tara:strand:+ start:897 stop:1403 length:507 start_codon:yes stop_codon:yes gene_type:complete
MSKGTLTYVTVHNFTSAEFQELSENVAIDSEQFFEDVVPFKREWGSTAYIELEDLEHDRRTDELSFICRTKWEAPVDWLRGCSTTQYFEDKLILAAMVNSYESYVHGYAVMNKDLLHDEVLLDVDASVISEMYERDEVDEVDEMIWDPIGRFGESCKELYIVPDSEGD